MGMTLEAVRDLYGEAQSLYDEAKELMAKDELTAEDGQKIDQLLDEVEAKKTEAERLERALGLGDHLDQRQPLPDADTRAPDVTIEYMGRKLDAEDVAELKAMGPFPGYVNLPNDPDAAAYRKAMRRYLRSKSNQDLTPDERKALIAGEGPAGGYLQQDTFVNQLIVKSRERSAMRRIAQVLPPVPSGSVIYPTEDSVFADWEWTAELATGSEDKVKPFGEIRLIPYPLAKRVKVSNTFLRVPTFDVEGYVRDRLAYKFGVTQEQAFINGDGQGQPLGLVTDPELPTYTTAVANKVDAIDIINWVYTLPAAYGESPTTCILCNRAFIRKARTLTHGDGTFVWQPGLQVGLPNRILDYEYETSDRFDDALDASDAWEGNKIAAVIGDFSYYWIVDAMQFSLQRLVELYAETNQTGYIGRGETDGKIVLHEAFLGLKIKA